MSDSASPTFVLVPTDLIETVGAGKLSKEAAWLYVVLLSHHNRTRRDNDVWPSRQVLAEKCGMKKPQSVDKYLTELREAGLIVSSERKRAGMFNTSSRHTLLLTVTRTGEEVAARRASHEAMPRSGQRDPLQGTSAVPARGHELDEHQLEEFKDEDPISRTAARFAPDGARHEDSKDQNLEDPWADDAQLAAGSVAPVNLPHQRATWENWHDADRQTFKEHVGETLISTGKNWKKGRYTAEAFYRSYRLKNEGAKRWPGQYVETLSYAGEEAVDDWLIDQGLLRPEWQ